LGVQDVVGLERPGVEGGTFDWRGRNKVLQGDLPLPFAASELKPVQEEASAIGDAYGAL
jgi:hypothetical protein